MKARFVRRHGKIDNADHVAMGDRGCMAIEGRHCARQQGEAITGFHRGENTRRHQPCGSYDNGAHEVAPVELHYFEFLNVFDDNVGKAGRAFKSADGELR